MTQRFDGDVRRGTRLGQRVAVRPRRSPGKRWLAAAAGVVLLFGAGMYGARALWRDSAVAARTTVQRGAYSLEISYQLPGTSQPVTAAISDGDDSFTIPLEAAQAAEMVPDLEEDPLPLVIPVTLRAQAAGNLSLAFSVELTSVPGAGTVFGRSDLDFTRVDAAAECAAPTSSVGISPVHQPSPAVEATAAPATVTSQVTQYWCLTVRYRGDGTYQSTATVTAGTSLVSGTGTQTREATATWESAVRPNPANEPVGAVHLRIAPLPLGVVNNG